MHRIGNSSKWQVANGEIRLSHASIQDSHICFARMARRINDRECLRLLRRRGSRTDAAVVGVIVIAGAAIRRTGFLTAGQGEVSHRRIAFDHRRRKSSRASAAAISGPR
jgi:hypothetical protein